MSGDRDAILARRAGYLAAALLGLGCTPTPAPPDGPVVDVPTTSKPPPAPTGMPEAPPPKHQASTCKDPKPVFRPPTPPPGVCLSIRQPGLNLFVSIEPGDKLNTAALDQLAKRLLEVDKYAELTTRNVDDWRSASNLVFAALIERGVPADRMCIRDPAETETRNKTDEDAVVLIVRQQ